MKSDNRRYLIGGLIAFLVLALLGVSSIWFFDNVLNGVVLDFLDSLMMGYNSTFESPIYDQGRIARVGAAALVLLALVLASTGTLCAWSAHRRQARKLERAQAEAERARQFAEREMQRKSDLITYLAHDLRTPLASVIAYLSLLRESPELEVEQRAKYTGVALEKALRLEQLTEELFEIIRFNLQSIELDRVRVRLDRMLEQLVDEFDPVLRAGGHSVALACPEDMELFVDPDKLARVFNNILKNAAAYSYAGSEIRIEAKQAADGAHIAFRNACDPIPEEALKRIFDKFYRLDAARSSRTGGSGLGLAIAKEIVEAHGGTIVARWADGGVSFEVCLPPWSGAR